MARTNKLKSRLERAVENRLDQIKLAIILEHDSQYAGNFKQLRDNVAAGKVAAEQLPAHRDWLIMASLRRNKVSEKEANRLIRA